MTLSSLLPCTILVLWFVHVKFKTKIISAGEAVETTHLYKVVNDQIQHTFSPNVRPEAKAENSLL